MVNIVFCISEGNHKRNEDEFSFKANTHIFGYNDSIIWLDRFLSKSDIRGRRVMEIKLQMKYLGDTVMVDLRRVCYIEIEKRIVEVHVTGSENSSYQVYAKMSDLERSLSKLGFIRVHRSYIVAIHYIEKIDKSEITLTIGKIIHIGRQFKQNVAAALCGRTSVNVVE